MTKRFVSLLAVLTLMVTLFIVPNTACAIYTAYSSCGNGKPLNVRSGPGKEYPVIGTIAYRDTVAVDHDLGNGWSELVWGSVPGYAMTSLMTTYDPGPYNPYTPTPTAVPYQDGSELNSVFRKARFVTPYNVTLRGTRGSGTVNVRWAPSLNSSLIQAYPYNSVMQVIAELGEWYQVVDPYTGITGFVMCKFAFR